MDIRKIDAKTIVFDEGGVRFFLLLGAEKALLIDSGMMTHNADELAREFTDLPLELLLTHADRDHIGSNAAFPCFYMHPSEASNYYNGNRGTGRFIPVWEGDVLDLGGRPLEIIHLPGHTPGSIAVLDRNHRRLFSGDPIQDGRIFMFGVQREMHAYRESLLRLEARKNEFDEIFPSHGTCPVGTDLILKLYDASGRILEGKSKGSPAEVHGNKISVHGFGFASFLCNPDSEEDTP